MKTVSATIFTAGWITVLAVLAMLAKVDGWVVATTAMVAIAGTVGSVAILVHDDRPARVDEEHPIERVSAEIVATPSQPRLALPAPEERELVRFR